MLTVDEILRTSEQKYSPDHDVRVLAREVERLRWAATRATELLERSERLIRETQEALERTRFALEHVARSAEGHRDTVPETPLVNGIWP